MSKTEALGRAQQALRQALTLVREANNYAGHDKYSKINRAAAAITDAMEQVDRAQSRAVQEDFFHG